MIGTAAGARSPIGVSFDQRFIKAAQLARRAQGWGLQAAVRVPRLSPGAAMDLPEAERLGKVLARQRFKGHTLVLAVPEEKLLTGVLELPPRSSGAPLEQIACAELARMHNYDPRQAETASWDVPTSTRAKDVTGVMAVACRHADADAILDAFEQAGLEVAGLYSHLSAIVLACRGKFSDAGVTALLEVEWDWAVITLLRQNEVIYTRAMPEAPVRQLWEGLSQRLGLDAESADCVLEDVGLKGAGAPDGQTDASFEAAGDLIKAHLEAILAELDAPFSYATHQYPGSTVDRVLLTGYGATIPGMVEHFASRLDLNVQQVAPSDVVDCAAFPGSAGGDASLTVAAGLALLGREAGA